MLGHVAIVGTRREALKLAEEMGASEAFAGITIFGREAEAPDHTVFARGFARYVYGLAPFETGTLAVLLAVADELVLETAVSVAGLGEAPRGCAAFHLSSVLPTEALAPLYPRGYALGTFHPLCGAIAPTGGLRTTSSEGSTTSTEASTASTEASTASTEASTASPQRAVMPSAGSTLVRGGHAAVTGSPAAIAVARQIAEALEAEVLAVPAGRRPLVDAASVMMGSYLEPLVTLSTRLMERAGITADEATPALVAIARLSLARVEQGGMSAVGGHPVREGDLERLALHLRALDPEDQRLYALFASEILRIEEPVLDAPTRIAMDELLSRYLDPQPTSVG